MQNVENFSPEAGCCNPIIFNPKDLRHNLKCENLKIFACGGLYSLNYDTKLVHIASIKLETEGVFISATEGIFRLRHLE